LLQELSGTVAFNVCKFAEGGGVAVEQRFNRARLTFDHCTFSAPNQPQNSPFLFRARTNGFSALDVAMTNCDLNDNVGGGIDLRSTDTSPLTVPLTATNLQRLGGIAVTGITEKGSHAIVELRNAHVFTPAVHDPSVQLTATATASLCTDIAGGAFTTPPKVVAVSPGARVVAAPCRP